MAQKHKMTTSPDHILLDPKEETLCSPSISAIHHLRTRSTQARESEVRTSSRLSDACETSFIILDPSQLVINTIPSPPPPPPPRVSNWVETAAAPLPTNPLVSFTTGLITIIIIFLGFILNILITIGKFDLHYNMTLTITILSLVPVIWVSYDDLISTYCRRKLKSALAQFLSRSKMPAWAKRQAENMQ